MTGAGDENLKEINVRSGGATVRLCGRGVCERAAEPLTLRISAATQRSLDEAMGMVEDLLCYIRQEHREFLWRSHPRRPQPRIPEEPVAKHAPTAAAPLRTPAVASAPSAPRRASDARHSDAGHPKPTLAEEAFATRPAASEEPRLQGLVKYFRGSFGWVACERMAKMYGDYDVFLHKSDCDGVPRQNEVVPPLERLQARAPSPERTSAADWFTQRMKR